MDSSYVEDAFEDAQQAFEQNPTHKESGLDVDDDALLQLRKACRLLETGLTERTRQPGSISSILYSRAFGSTTDCVLAR